MASPIGKCALCLAENVALQDSHVIPTWAYKRLRDTRPAQNPNPVLVTNGRALQTSDQVSKYLLCRDCEQRFGVEDNYVSKLAFKDGVMPAVARLGSNRASVGPLQFTELGSLSASRLAYFAASVVWRGHAACSVPDCSLGSYAEAFRLYLNGQKPFPRSATAMLCVLRDDEIHWLQVADVMCLPQTQRKGPEDSHEFALCGLYFTVRTGNYSPATCLAGPTPIVGLVPRSLFLKWIAAGFRDVEFVGRRPPVRRR